MKVSCKTCAITEGSQTCSLCDTLHSNWEPIEKEYINLLEKAEKDAVSSGLIGPSFQAGKAKEQAPKNDNIEAKPDMAYLPMDLLEKVANAFAFGGIKGYPRNSWRKGFSISKLIAAARRHDADFWDKGETFDKQAKEEYGVEVYHSAMVIFNHLCILDALINHPELDDRLKKD